MDGTCKAGKCVFSLRVCEPLPECSQGLVLGVLLTEKLEEATGDRVEVGSLRPPPALP